MQRRIAVGLLLIISLTFVGCQTKGATGEKNVPVPSAEGQDQPIETPQAPEPTEESLERMENTPAPMRGEEYIVARAVSDLSQRLGVAEDDIQVVGVEAVEWSDSSLGCPAEGMDYAQVITPGYEITLRVDEKEYSYHSDEGRFMLLCAEDGTVEILPIPIQPGDKIQDDSPWMPVD